MLSHDQSQRLNIRNLLVFFGDVFGSSAAPMESTTCTPMSLLHGRHPVSTVDGSVFRTGKKNPVDDLVKDTIPTPRFLRRSSTRNSLPCAEGVYPQNFLWLVIKNFRSRACTSTNFLRLARSRVGRQVARPKSVPVPDHPRRQCFGSKKWNS